MTGLTGHSHSSSSGSVEDRRPDAPSEDADTPVTDALLDQFSVYYLVAVLAVRALEEARLQRALAEAG